MLRKSREGYIVTHGTGRGKKNERGVTTLDSALGLSNDAVRFLGFEQWPSLASDLS